MIRQLTEIVQETRRLRDRCKSCLVRIHHCPPPATQWITTDSALQPFVTLLFTRLPWASPVTRVTTPRRRCLLGTRRRGCTWYRPLGSPASCAKPAARSI